MNYSSDEIQTAVEQIIRASVRTPTGVLGERRVDTSYTDLQEAASGVYILYFNAPFYTIGLGATRLLDATQTQAQTINAVVDAIKAMGNLVTPVEDISALANSRAALQELEAAVGARAQGFQDITAVPAFRRYAQNINAFVQTYGANVKGMVEEDGAEVPGIVDTPSGAKSKISGLITTLVDQHRELIRRATLLAGAMDDFAKLQLPQVAAQGVISRAREVLDAHYEDMAGQTPAQRLENLRGVMLDLLTQQPLVEKYGAALGPSEYVTTKGQGTAYSDGTHLSTPARLVSEIPGPYSIVASNQNVRLTIDGGTPVDFPMAAGYVAEMRAIIAGPYLFDGTNDALQVTYGVPESSMVTYDVTFAHGTLTAQDVALAINTVLGLSSLRCEAIFLPTKYDSYVTTTNIGTNAARFMVMAGSMQGFNILVGDEVDVLTGASSGTVWTITAVDPSGAYVDASGSVDIVPEGLPDGVRIQIGAPNKAVRLYDTAGAVSIQQRRLIGLPVTGGNADKGAAVIGFYPGAQVRSRPVAAKDLASYISLSTTLLSASVEFEPSHYIGMARSYQNDAGRVVLSKCYSSGTLGAGMLVSYTPSAALPSTVAIGDKVVIRETIEPADIYKVGTISQVTPTVQIVFLTSTVGGAVAIDIGPPMSSLLFGFGDVLVVKDGPNQGRYVVREPAGYGTDSPLEVLLEAALPVPIEGGTFTTFSVEFGEEAVAFESRLQQTTSSVVVANPSGGSGAEYFFHPASLPANAVGTTPWLRFTNYPLGAQVGDSILVFETDFATPSAQRQIVAMDQAASVLKAAPTFLPTDSFSFDFNHPIPFARIRVTKVADYNTFSAQLKAWLALPQQQERYLAGILPVLNPLLTTSNPSAVQIGDAVKYFKDMAKFLTTSAAMANNSPVAYTLEFALSTYKPAVEEPVDTLLGSFRHKGADRAIDLLLEGQFSAFFGLALDETSYSGTLLKGLREMAREDLPVRKYDRRNLIGQTLIGTAPGQKDSEFNAEDADSPQQPDIPIGDSLVRPGSNQ